MLVSAMLVPAQAGHSASAGRRRGEGTRQDELITELTKLSHDWTREPQDVSLCSQAGEEQLPFELRALECVFSVAVARLEGGRCAHTLQGVRRILTSQRQTQNRRRHLNSIRNRVFEFESQPASVGPRRACCEL